MWYCHLLNFICIASGLTLLCFSFPPTTYHLLGLLLGMQTIKLGVMVNSGVRKTCLCRQVGHFFLFAFLCEFFAWNGRTYQLVFTSKFHLESNVSSLDKINTGWSHAISSLMGVIADLLMCRLGLLEIPIQLSYIVLSILSSHHGMH